MRDEKVEYGTRDDPRQPVVVGPPRREPTLTQALVPVVVLIVLLAAVLGFTGFTHYTAVAG